MSVIKAKISQQYVYITQKEMEDILLPRNFSIDETDFSKEIVYIWFFPNQDHAAIRVYSSIDKNLGISRDCGQDAIRIVLWDNWHRKILDVAEKRVNRTFGWDIRLVSRLREVYLAAKMLRLCPKCKSQYMVERTKKIDGSKFYGCRGFPNCRFTCEIH